MSYTINTVLELVKAYKRWEVSTDQVRAALEALVSVHAQPQQPVAAQQQEAKPNMFWNHDDPESHYRSIDEFLNDEWGQIGIKVGETRTVLQAIRLPNVTVRVTAVSDDGDIDYVIEAASPQQPTPRSWP